jgi:hypothetical protein
MQMTTGFPRTGGKLSILSISAMLLASCLSGGGSESDEERNNSSPQDPSNSAPRISGTPAANVTEGVNYSFTPTTVDDDSDTLQFSVTRLPSWASFSQSSGRISGRADAGDVGVYTDISITVSDGTASDTLGPFSIEVLAQGAATGAVTLHWSAPTMNEDGSPLTDLAGYRIYWRINSVEFRNSVSIDNPGITSYVVDNLSSGTYEFAATSFNTAGIESQFSNTTTHTVP